MKGFLVTLTQDELDIGEMIAQRMMEESHSSGRKDNHGLTDATPEITVNGIYAEMAAAKGLNHYWCPRICTFKGPDIGVNIQVRWTKHQNGHLVVRRPDPIDHTYILVTGLPPIFRIVGWIDGVDAKNDHFLSNMGIADRPLAFCVPQGILKDFDFKAVMVPRAEEDISAATD